jgi:hypothetical protein
MDRETDGPASVGMPSSRLPKIDRFQSGTQDLSPKTPLRPEIRCRRELLEFPTLADFRILNRSQ